MKRPTIRDLAKAADVSVATVNRILGGSAAVKLDTREAVRAAAEAIGFYGLGAIDSRLAAAKPHFRFGFLLQQPNRVFYRDLAQALRNAALDVRDSDITVQIEFLDELSPQNIADRITALGAECDAIGVVAAVHPLVAQAVDNLQANDIPVFALISQLSAVGQINYVGLDNWKVGRTAAWAFEHICKAPGKLATLVGNHRYRCQEMNETGFRSYFREYASGFVLLEAQATFESGAIAQELTDKLLADHPDLVGLYIAGGGISGALSAIRSSGRAGQIVVVGYDLTDTTRKGLIDGSLTFLISHPLTRLAAQAMTGMIKSCTANRETVNFTSVLPFEIYTRENL
jgi:LacI family transcriptional regulator